MEVRVSEEVSYIQSILEWIEGKADQLTREDVSGSHVGKLTSTLLSKGTYGQSIWLMGKRRLTGEED